MHKLMLILYNVFNLEVEDIDVQDEVEDIDVYKMRLKTSIEEVEDIDEEVEDIDVEGGYRCRRNMYIDDDVIALHVL